MSDDHTRNAGDRSGDDRDEMTRRPRLDDRTADALFSGRIPPGCEDHADVAAFADALRAAASTAPAPVPGPALHALLADGLSTDMRDLPATVGTAAPGPASRWSGAPTRRRTKKMLELLIAKLAGISLLAKTGIASAAVVAGTTGAGLTGALPPQAQDAFDRAFAEAPDEPADRDADEAAEIGVTDDVTDTDGGETVDVTAREDTTETTGTTDDESADAGQGSRPEVPGAEGRATADANAGENGQHGRDNATEAATDGREFGQRKADEARQRNDNAPAEEAQQRRETAPAEGRQTGTEASKGRAGTGEAPADEDGDNTTDPDDDPATDDGPETAERGASEDTPAGSTQDGGNASDSARQNAPADDRP